MLPALTKLQHLTKGAAKGLTSTYRAVITHPETRDEPVVEMGEARKIPAG
ncbi:MAG: hypothetical protein ACFFD4_33440 [Candidatus Odinarchaeota archaeon]